MFLRLTFRKFFDQNIRKADVTCKVCTFHLDDDKLFGICMEKHTFWKKMSPKFKLWVFHVMEKNISPEKSILKLLYRKNYSS